MNAHRFGVISLLLALPPLCAQGRVWIVDAANGPGTNFTDLPTAVSSVAAGDVLRVRAGLYAMFQISNAITILADPGVTVGQSRWLSIAINTAAGPVAIV